MYYLWRDVMHTGLSVLSMVTHALSFELTPIYAVDFKSGMLQGYDDAVKNGEGDEFRAYLALDMATLGLAPMIRAADDPDEFGQTAGANAVMVFAPFAAAKGVRAIPSRGGNAPKVKTLPKENPSTEPPPKIEPVVKPANVEPPKLNKPTTEKPAIIEMMERPGSPQQQGD